MSAQGFQAIKVGFIGAGRMGRPMVDRLTAAGHHVTVLVRRPDARAAAEQGGLRWAETVAAVVREADVVFVAVFDDDQAREVCLGPDGAVAAMKPGATIVLHTTCDPKTPQVIASSGAERGVRLLDAPFSGGPQDIAWSTLTLWVGGDQAVLEHIRPLLASYASPITHVGAVGDGQRMKLVNNALFAAQVTLAMEAVRIARSLGLEENVVLPALQHGSAASRALSILARGGSVEATAARLSEWLRKDVATVRSVAERSIVDLGVIGTVLTSDVSKPLVGR